MQHKPIIEVSDLANCLGGYWVHKGLNFSVGRGEIVAIVGGSGSGKTTLLRSILMLLKPTSGSIRVFDQEITKCTESQALSVRNRWGVAFQQGALFSSLTVAENVMFPMRIYDSLPKYLQKELALLKISLAGLSLEAANKYPSELSGGMLKRAAIARAIAMDPELVFLDEPTSGLDPQSAGAFDDLILHLRDTLCLTIVMVTHDLDSLWHATDKVAFLGDGKVLAIKPMKELVKDKHPMIQAYFSGPRGQIRIQEAEDRG